MCFRFYADFTGADPRCRQKPKPKPTEASPAWEGEPEPLRSAS